MTKSEKISKLNHSIGEGMDWILLDVLRPAHMMSDEVDNKLDMLITDHILNNRTRVLNELFMLHQRVGFNV